MMLTNDFVDFLFEKNEIIKKKSIFVITKKIHK